MLFFDILRLALRNLREAKLRAVLTTMGVVVGVAVIVTMVSFGLGLQRNTVERFNNLDLFNEITVQGRSLSNLIANQLEKNAGGEEEQSGEKGDDEEAKPDKKPVRNRVLDDAAIEEIGKIAGVSYVEPNVNFNAYVRLKDATRQQFVGGVRVPNAASRFKNFAAGRMIEAAGADEAIVDESFLKIFGFKNAAEAVGQTVELLAPERAKQTDEAGSVKDENGERAGDEEELSFFGMPLGGGGDDEGTASENEMATAEGGGLASRQFKIVGVLKDEIEGAPSNRTRFRGLMPVAAVYVPLGFAREWRAKNRGSLDEVAVQLARRSGMLGEGDVEGYESATVRVENPLAVKDVLARLDAMNFGTFSLVSQLDEIRTFFLIVNAALGLLGSISLLVASLGIANTMIMSILERTREIGIMKAIGAEDREIKLIFFVEAGVIGLLGGVLGALAAWGIDKLANRLAYEFLLKPRGADFIDFFSLPPYLWLGAILFAMVVSVLAALYPAARAARIDPVRALRHD